MGFSNQIPFSELPVGLISLDWHETEPLRWVHAGANVNPTIRLGFFFFFPSAPAFALVMSCVRSMEERGLNNALKLPQHKLGMVL